MMRRVHTSCMTSKAWGIVTKPTGGDSTYIGGRRPPGAPRKAGIAFYNPDGSRLSAAGEKRLWDVYEEFEKEEGEYVATLAENNDDKLVSDVHAMVLANKKPPLSETDLRFLQWHIESEYVDQHLKPAPPTPPKGEAGGHLRPPCMLMRTQLCFMTSSSISFIATQVRRGLG